MLNYSVFQTSDYITNQLGSRRSGTISALIARLLCSITF